MINIGIIGYGYWGPNLVRNFFSTENCKITMISDFNKSRLDILNKNFPGVITTTNAEDILFNKNIDAVIIATPVFTHYNLARIALMNNKHVFIEKPMTSDVESAMELVNLAKSKNLILMVDHTFLYTDSVYKIKNLINEGFLGQLNYFDSTRINLGLFQPDVNVLWDLAPHDISILLYIKNELPFSVNATGISHTGNGIENIAYLTINYMSNFIAHINCSWSSPTKVRSTLIGGTQKMIVFNDLEPSEKIRLYDTSFKFTNFDEKNKILVDYRVGDIQIPKIENTEALKNVAHDFINSIEKNRSPISNGEIGLSVVKILQAAQKSIKSNGKEIKL